MAGIKTWKPPNQSPQIKAMRHENLFMVKPLQMDTEKASIDRPTAIRRSSMKSSTTSTKSGCSESKKAPGIKKTKKNSKKFSIR